MSAWKRVALEKLPEFRRTIDAADNAGALWIELYLKFEDVYQASTLNDDLIRRFFEYARWCLQSPGQGHYLSEAGTAAVCSFYEHLPTQPAIRRDLRRWLTLKEFRDLSHAFQYFLSEQEFADFETEFLDPPK